MKPPSRRFLGVLFRNLKDDIKHLPRRNSVYWLAGGGALTLAAHYGDAKVNHRLVGSPTADTFFIPGKYVGYTWVQVGTSVATYTVGRTTDKPRAQHLGMDLLEAQLLTEGIVQTAKVIIRRERPVNADGSQASGYAFPSGHSAVTFASATVLQQHLGWKAAVPTFALASYVATSRLHDNRHRLSDVVMGATTGIIVGRSVTWHGRNVYNVSFAPLPKGLMATVNW